MTNSIELSHQEIAALFENGKCLTFPWFYNPEVAKYKSQIRQEFQQKFKVKCMVVSKRDALIPNSSKYHYFSSYCARKVDTGEIIAVFTLSNDAMIIDNSDDKEEFIQQSSSRFNDEYIPIFRSQTSFPAINIGHYF